MEHLTKNKHYTASVNGHWLFENIDTDTIGECIAIGNDEYHLVANNTSIRLKVVDINYGSKTFVIQVKGQKYTVTLEDAFDQLIKNMGFSAYDSHTAGNIKAPMPGLVLDILVTKNEKVEAGTPLLILEAMKMENVIKADGHGTIKAIAVEKGMPVEKGQLLIEMT